MPEDASALPLGKLFCPLNGNSGCIIPLKNPQKTGLLLLSIATPSPLEPNVVHVKAVPQTKEPLALYFTKSSSEIVVERDTVEDVPVNVTVPPD
jgi:hypothetical protein